MNEKMQPKRMEDFKNYLQQQGKSPVTIKEYARQVSLFISWYGVIGNFVSSKIGKVKST